MTMDYQMSLQQYIVEISNQLADAETLNATQIVQKLQTITNSGYQQYIIQTIRTCIQHYQKERLISKYAHVVDKLLKLPIWNQIMQNVIVQFFCDIFIFLLIQKCYNQIDQLKIIRKFWLKTIHPRYLQNMKDTILLQTGIDIDQHFKAEAISLLKIHYEKKLRLTPEEMNFHLPKTLKTSNSIYESKILKTQPGFFVENPNYLISQIPSVPIINQNINPTIVRQSVSPQSRIKTPNPPYINNPYNTPYNSMPINSYYPINQNPQNNYHTKQNINRVSPPIDPRDPRIKSDKQMYFYNQGYVQKQNIPSYPQKTQNINESLKRERLYSEQTRTSNSAQYMMSQGQYQNNNIMFPQDVYQMNPYPMKKIHYNDEIQFLRTQPEKKQKETQKPKYAKILQMLRSDKVYKCKQCGKGYKNVSQYEKHLTEHFEEKLAMKEKRKQPMKLLKFDDWTVKGSNSSFQQFDQFYITLSNQQKQNFQALQLKCKFCNQSFDLKFYGDSWVLNNATRCQIKGEIIPMHKTCQQALEESSSDENF